MFCSKCGTRNEDYSKFCYQCGSQLQQAVLGKNQPQEPDGYRIYSQPQAAAGNDAHSEAREPMNRDDDSQLQAAASSNIDSQQQEAVNNNTDSQLQESVNSNVYSQPQEPVNSNVYSQPQEPVNNNVYSQPQAPLYNPVYGQPQTPVTGNIYNQQQPPVNNPIYGQPQAPVYNNSYGQPQPGMYQQPYPPYQQRPAYGQSVSQDKLTRKSRKPLIISLAGIAVVAIIVLFVTLLFPLGGGKVLDNILKAAKGTLEAKSVEFNVNYVESSDRKRKESVKGVFVYDLDKGKLEYDFVNQYSRQILYKGIMYDVDDGEIWWSEDVSREIDDLLEYYDEYKKGMDGISKVDWEDVLDEVGLSRYITTSQLEKCIKEFEKNMNSQSYFKEVCEEFSIKKTKDGTLYTFEVNVPQFAESLIDTFEPVISKDIDDVKDEILDELDIFDEMILEITISKGKLVEIHADITMEGWDGKMESYELTVSLKNYGKASLDEDKIQKLIDNQNSR